MFFSIILGLYHEDILLTSSIIGFLSKKQLNLWTYYRGAGQHMKAIYQTYISVIVLSSDSVINY